MSFVNLKALMAVSFVSLLACGCAEQEEAYVDRSVEELYNMAMDHFEAQKYQKAAKSFEEVERQHPYSNWAVKAQLMAAYCFYEAKKYDEAIESFKLFIQLHPGHAEVAYALYMQGLCYYEQIPIVERDQKPSENAHEQFEEVLRRFPDSVYAKDSRLKLDLIRDHLAGKEMDVGRYYQNRGGFPAAINRFKEVVTRYQNTSHVPEALHRLVECCLALQLYDDAKSAAAVLQQNFATSDWYKDTYKLIETNAPQLLPK